MIKTVIFDVDGVIVLSEQEFTRILVKLVNNAYDLDVVEDDLNDTVGERIENRLKGILEKEGIRFDDKKYLEIADVIRESYAKNFSLKANPGLINFIEKLKQKKIKIGLGTNGSKSIVMKVLDKLEIKDLFDCIVTFDDVKNGKPQPDIYLKNAEKLRVKPEECVVFEDSLSGITAAKRAGMKVVALTTTLRNEYLLDADKIIDGFHDIDVDYLEKLR